MVDFSVLAIDVVHLVALAEPTCLILAFREDSDGYHPYLRIFDLYLEVLDVLLPYGLLAVCNYLLIRCLSYPMSGVFGFFVVPFEVVAGIEL